MLLYDGYIIIVIYFVRWGFLNHHLVGGDWNILMIFPFHIWDVILPIDFHIFQDG